jgi:hypothetical protein
VSAQPEERPPQLILQVADMSGHIFFFFHVCFASPFVIVVLFLW